jgi:hypothetical protein
MPHDVALVPDAGPAWGWLAVAGVPLLIQVLIHYRDHQPHRMISRQPLPHVRRQQERLIAQHRPVSLRNTPIFSKDH